MFLALRDLRVAKGRFALVGAVIALVALMSTLLSGLATGLVNDGISGLRALPLTHLAFQSGAGSTFSRSTLTPETLQAFQSLDDVAATPIGMSFLNAKSEHGTSLDIALFGVDPDGFLAQESAAIEEGEHADLSDGSLVLSDDLADEAEIGEVFTVPGSDVQLQVVGFTFSGTYGHVPIAYSTLDTWEELIYGSATAERFSAIAIQADGVDFTAVDQTADTDTVTKEASFAGSPGYSAETATMSLIRGFLLVISALVVGAFFTVWTVQRTRQIGLLKAMGASTIYIVRDALGQLAVVLAASIALGVVVGLGIGSLIGEDAPFSLTMDSVLPSALALGVTGMAGSLVAIRRLTRVDPVLSLAAET